MVYKNLYIVLIFWVCIVSGSDFRSGFRTSSPKNGVEARKHDKDDISYNSSERQEKSKLNFRNIKFWVITVPRL